MTFRKDINGLRAIAILAVICFHFRIAGFTGGFSGVDIFFVISGFLMTAIIFNKLDKGQFLLLDFYLHRARRIIPALALLCIVIILFGFFSQLTNEYRETLRNIKSTIFFRSNYDFYKDFNYFASPSQENWLLHSWSLSVEWQFYLIYPIIILFLRKFINFYLTKIILLILTIILLGICIYYTPINSSAAFFLLPTRAWEMLAGGLVFLYPLKLSNFWKKITGNIGLLLIFITIFGLNKEQSWPSYLASIPVLGTMLVIMAQNNSILTNNIFCQWLGRISYSIYLWHWPIVVLLLTSDLINNIYFISIGIVISVILGQLSYSALESRITLKENRIKELIKYSCIIIFIASLAASTASLVKKHPQMRTGPFFSSTFQQIEYLTNMRHPYDEQCMLMKDRAVLPECKIGQGTPSLIIIGDSHANSIFSAVLTANDKDAIILWAFMGCPIVKDIKFTISRREGCLHLINEKLKLLDTAYSNTPILIVNRLFNLLGNKNVSPQIYFSKPVKLPTTELLNEFKSHYLKTLCTLAQKHPVYVLKPIPEPGFDVPKKLARENLLGLTFTNNSTSLLEYYQKNAFVLDIMHQAQQQCDVKLLDPVPYLCPDGYCLSSEAGKPFYFDDNHLTEYGNKKLVPLFKTKLFNRN